MAPRWAGHEAKLKTDSFGGIASSVSVLLSRPLLPDRKAPTAEPSDPRRRQPAWPLILG